MRRGLVGAAAMVLLAACGGGGGMTKADYVKRANATCADAAKQLAALHLPEADDVTSMPKAAASIVALERKALDRLRSIHPPRADRAEIAKWIALVDQTIDQAETSAASQRDGDIQRAVTANVNGAALDRRADQLARAYGLKRCVHAAVPPASSAVSSPATSSTTKAE